MSEKKFKWASPQEWLLDKINNEWTPDEVQAFARNTALAADADEVQDEYQSDMEADDYFNPLCDECGEPIPESEDSEVNEYHKDSCSLHPDNSNPV